MRAIRFVPSRQLAWLGLATLVSGFILELIGLRHIAVIIGAFALLVSIADLLSGWKLPPVQFHRQVPPTLIRGRTGSIELSIINESSSRWHVRLLDHLPMNLMADVPVEQFNLSHAKTITYQVQPWQRGDYQLDKVFSEWASPLRLWWRKREDSVPASLKVVPNALAINSELPGNAQIRGGFVRQRRQGNGTEFLQLRDWQQGESARQIDWKATARRHRLIAKETEVEREQQLVFIIDTGPTMSYRDDKSSLLDHALDASLLIASDAMKRGDSVGVVTNTLWLAPQSGRKGLVNISDHCTNLHTNEGGGDILQAAQTLVKRSRRRTMAIILTSSEQSSDMLSAAQNVLRQSHHKVMVAAMDNPELLDQVHDAMTPTEVRTALSLAADRRKQIDHLSQQQNFIHSEPRAFAVKLLAQWQQFRASA